jgi:TolB protein
MKKLLCLFLALAAPLLAQRQIGNVVVEADNKTLPVRVSANTPELNALALQAFGAHGRYHVVASGYAYDIRFSQVAPTQVRVDLARGLGETVGSVVVSGTSARNALLRAADVAVEKTNGLGLRGFFASRLAWVGKATGHDEIYTSDLFFGEAKQITHDRSITFTPRWSPDGSKIIYTSYYHSGSPDIFQIDLANAYTRTTFVSFRGSNSGARFSPDGREVAMVLSGEGPTEIYVSNAQGHQVSRRTRADSNKASPCWSPDGSRLVFTSGNPSPQLYVMAAAGGPMQRLTYGFSSECSEPDWSRANPNLIAFTMRSGGNYQIAEYDFSSHESHQVSRAAFDAMGASWLPDGRHLVYTASSASTSRLCILDTETGNSRPISPASFGQAERASVWSP